MISAYILTMQFQKTGLSPVSSTFLHRYFKRRVLRIEPPYLILLTVTFLFLSASGYVPEDSRRFADPPSSLSLSWISSIFYMHGILFGSFPRLFPPGWSLEIEVQFYLVAPLFFLLLFQQYRPRLPLMLAVLALCYILSCASRLADPSWHLRYTICFFAYEFVLGMIFASHRDAVRGWAIPCWLKDCGAALGLLLLVSRGTVVPTAPIAMVLKMASGIVAVSLIMVAALDTRSAFSRFCARPWIALIGGACYSLYLIHLQTLQASGMIVKKLLGHMPIAISLPVSALVQIPIVIVIGLLFYIFVERPFMQRDWPQRLAGFLTMGSVGRAKYQAAVAPPPSADR